MINEKRLCDEFARLAGIASPSFREGAIAADLARRFGELGAEVEFDDAGERIGSESGNLIARFPAAGKQGEALLLSAHMDTVEPADGVRPVLRDGVFRSAGDTVLGADDKAGIAEIIEALCVLRDQDIPHGPIEVVISVCEEKGLLGAKQLDLKRLHATRGIALDTCGVDSVTARAPGANRLRVEIEGIESHAGIAPERGISAIQVAARAIERMPLGRIDADTVANIGRIDGGVADNIVAKKVTLTGEARSHHPDKLRRQTEAMLAACTQAAEDLAGVIDGVRRTATITSRVHADYPLMHIDEDAPVLRLIRDASAALGAPCTVLTGGGGSDANIFTAGGIPTVILGSGMTDVHSIHESVSVADLVRVSRLLVEVLQRAW